MPRLGGLSGRLHRNRSSDSRILSNNGLDGRCLSNRILPGRGFKRASQKPQLPTCRGLDGVGLNSRLVDSGPGKMLFSDMDFGARRLIRA